jgi:hypothetical protein
MTPESLDLTNWRASGKRNDGCQRRLLLHPEDAMPVTRLLEITQRLLR